MATDTCCDFASFVVLNSIRGFCIYMGFKSKISYKECKAIEPRIVHSKELGSPKCSFPQKKYSLHFRCILSTLMLSCCRCCHAVVSGRHAAPKDFTWQRHWYTHTEAVRCTSSNPITIGHPFLLLRRNLSCLFTVAELRSLYRRLGHQKAEKLNSLLRRPQTAEVA